MARVLTSNNRKTNPFGATSAPYSKSNPHAGVDFAYFPDPYNYAPENGVVTYAGAMGTCGKGINITGDSGDKYRICHNSKLLVKTGQRVKIVQKIGRVGATGYVFGAHNHTVLWLNGRRVDITKHIKKRPKDYLKENKVYKGRTLKQWHTHAVRLHKSRDKWVERAKEARKERDELKAALKELNSRFDTMTDAQNEAAQKVELLEKQLKQCTKNNQVLVKDNADLEDRLSKSELDEPDPMSLAELVKAIINKIRRR